jgi:hypothetical protein
MTDQAPPAVQAELERLVGAWTLEIDFPGMNPIGPGTRVSFEWMPGGWFLVERWEIPVPEFPDGTAVIGWDPRREVLLQHYFDSRGVARVYEMHIDGRAWTLTRTEPDFSPLDFAQRFVGEFSDNGRTITGRWDAREPGKDWATDFHVTYRKQD